MDEITIGRTRLRSLERGKVEMLSRGTWKPAPLRALATRYAPGRGPWPWMLEQGVRRPSPSGRSTPEDEREGIRVRLGGAATERARVLSERWGCSVAEAVERALLASDERPRALRSFFKFFGSKARLATRYPAPEHEVIVEPFAGGAGYSLQYWDRKVVLVERDARIAALWRYLRRVRPSEVRRIPLLGPDDTTDALGDVAEEAKILVGMWLHSGSQSPRKKPGAWMRSGLYPDRFWGVRVRERIAMQVERIRHWRIVEGDYKKAPEIEATWFIDPPYEREGRAYRHGSAEIDYRELGAWCRSRKGLVVACESVGARWLPFKAFASTRANRTLGRERRTEEALFIRRT